MARRGTSVAVAAQRSCKAARADRESGSRLPLVYDVLFTEPNRRRRRACPRDRAESDLSAGAARRCGATRRAWSSTPVAPLARAAAGLGHINLEVDSDGIVRSVAQFEGDADSRWPQLMRDGRKGGATGRVCAESAADEPGERSARRAQRRKRRRANPDAKTPTQTPTQNQDDASTDGRFLIPFSRNAGSATRS